MDNYQNLMLFLVYLIIYSPIISVSIFIGYVIKRKFKHLDSYAANLIIISILVLNLILIIKCIVAAITGILVEKQIAQFIVYFSVIEKISIILCVGIFCRGLFCCFQPKYLPINWVALLFTPVWAIWTKNYKGLWALIPVVGLSVSIFYGFYGNIKKNE